MVQPVFDVDWNKVREAVEKDLRGDYVPDDCPDGTGNAPDVPSMVKQFAAEQEPLGGEFAKALSDNLSGLYTMVKPDVPSREDVAECLLHTPEEAYADNGEAFPVRETLRARLAWLEAERDALRKAGQAVIDRWRTPAWKNVEHTAVYINNLASVIAPPKETE